MNLITVRVRLLAPLALAALVALAGAGRADDEKKDKIDPKEIAKLIDLLGDDDDDKRAAAEKKLIEWGEQSHEHVKKAMKDHPDADVRLRAVLLEKTIARGAFRELRRMTGHTKTVRGVAVSKDGKRAVTCGEDKTVRLWDLTTGKEIKKFEGHTGFTWQASFTGDGKQILSSGGPDKTVRLWDVEKGEEVKQYTGFGVRWAYAAVLSPDEKYLAGGEGGLTPEEKKAKEKGDDVNANYDVHLFDRETGKSVHRLKGHTGYVWRAVFSPDGSKLVTSGMDDGSYRVWDVAAGKELVVGKDAHEYVTGLAFSPDGKTLFTCGRDALVKAWDPATGRLVRSFEKLNGACEAIALSRDGKRLLATADKAVAVFDVDSGRAFHRFEEHTAEVCAVAFTPDGNKAVSAGKDNTVRLWSIPK